MGSYSVAPTAAVATIAAPMATTQWRTTYSLAVGVHLQGLIVVQVFKRVSVYYMQICLSALFHSKKQYNILIFYRLQLSIGLHMD
jgi:hypothetical protein